MCHLYVSHANQASKLECALVSSLQKSIAKQQIGTPQTTQLGSDFVGVPDSIGIVAYDQQYPSFNRRLNAHYADANLNAVARQVYSKTIVSQVRYGTTGCNSPLNKAAGLASF